MTPDLQRRVQRYGWDRAANHYETYWKAQLKPAQSAALEEAALQPGETVLDVACGTGLATLPAARSVGPNGSVVATDISETMVQMTRDAAASESLSWVTAERMDAEALSVGAASFDAALCVLGLMYVPDPVAALKQVRNTLRPGGRFVAAVWGARSNCGWAEIFPIVDSRVNTDVCPLFFQLGTGETLATTFDMAGYGNISQRRLNVDLRYETADEAIGAAFAGGPVALAYARFDDVTRDAAHAEYLASIEQYKNGTGFHIPGEFVIVTGTLPAGSAS